MVHFSACFLYFNQERIDSIPRFGGIFAPFLPFWTRFMAAAVIIYMVTLMRLENIQVLRVSIVHHPV